MKKEIVAMVLAGGQGSRLGILTKNLAKPAVHFGGKYRIIDFSLSNCANSGIDTVGILTQYKPLILNRYIGTGDAWDLNKRIGGVSILPPYMKEAGGEWYKGTANAVYQNMEYIDMFDPEYVLILSGDHIYTMDYALMLDYHKENGADATIAVREVPWEEASRFGIMNTRSDGKIVEFEEKPNVPKNNLASMGVYIFNWKALKENLMIDEENCQSNNDFGKNVIPQMLRGGNRMFAYPFKGYWKDVGTVESLWEANMDLLKDVPELNLYDQEWKVYSVETLTTPQYISKEAIIKSSMVHDGCKIMGKLDKSILFQGVYVGKNSIINDSIIMPNVYIEENVIINKAIIGEGSVIKKGCVIGSTEKESLTVNADPSNKGIVLIGEGIVLEEDIKIRINSVISEEDWEDYLQLSSKEEEVAI